MRQAQILRWLIAVVMMLGVSGLALAADSADKVQMKVTAGKPNPDGTQTLTIDLEVAAGWHIYANPVENETLAPNATKVTISKGTEAFKDAKIDYPKGALVKDKDIGDYFQYEGKVQIKATVKRAAGAGPLKVAVKIQACDDKNCLKPATVEKSID